MRYKWILLSFALAGRSLLAQAVPVYKEPRHRLVFQNALVRVLDVRVPAGDTTNYHVHANHHIAVVIAGARTWDQKLGQEAPPADSVADSPGFIFDNASQSLPYTHRVGNVDTMPFHYVVGQQLSSSGVNAVALAASSGLRLDRETSGARVYRVTLAPGQSTPAHLHAQPGLTVQVGPGALRLEGTAPEAASNDSGAGAWWWRAAGSRHVLRNVGTQPVEIVEVDWR